MQENFGLILRTLVFRRLSLIFADFCLSWEAQHFGGADFRRKPQETAEVGRKLRETAEFCRHPFVRFSLSLAFSSALPISFAPFH